MFTERMVGPRRMIESAVGQQKEKFLFTTENVTLAVNYGKIKKQEESDKQRGLMQRGKNGADCRLHK